MAAQKSCQKTVSKDKEPALKLAWSGGGATLFSNIINSGGWSTVQSSETEEGSLCVIPRPSFTLFQHFDAQETVAVQTVFGIYVSSSIFLRPSFTFLCRFQHWYLQCVLDSKEPIDSTHEDNSLYNQSPVILLDGRLMSPRLKLQAGRSINQSINRLQKQ